MYYIAYGKLVGVDQVTSALETELVYRTCSARHIMIVIFLCILSIAQINETKLLGLNVAGVFYSSKVSEMSIIHTNNIVSIALRHAFDRKRLHIAN